MTAIAGYADGNSVWMAADSSYCYSSGEETFTGPCAEPKILKLSARLNNKKTRYLIGFSGDIRLKQHLLYNVRLPAVNSRSGGDLEMGFIIRDIIPRIEKAASETGTTGTELIGINGRLFEVDSNGSVTESTYKFNTTGVTCEITRAALMGIFSAKPNIRVEDALIMALQTAQKIMPDSVAPPFNIRSVQKN